MALEHRDLDGARAALREVYEANPSHPALPLLAAGIRRVRGSRVPWRPLVLLFVLMTVVVVGMRAWMVPRSASPTARVSAEDTTPAALAPSPTVPSPPARPLESSSAPTGTSGDATPTAPPREPATRTPGNVPSPLSDEAQIRQVITRFATVYGNRWTRLALSPCTIGPTGDSTVVTCQARGTRPDGAAAAGGVWTFSCRKVDGVWKIVSVQPPNGPGA